MKKILFALIVVLTVALPQAQTDPSTLPLVQQADVVYRGGFRVPDSAIDGADLSYGGRAIAFNPAKRSLFIGGIYGSKVAEITIPATLVNSTDSSAMPQSTYAQQAFVDPTDGHMSELSTSSTVLGGLLVRADRLIGSAAIYYDGTGAAQVSHFSRSTNLTTPSFSGWSKVGDRPGFTAGYMIDIPAEHQARLGGTALTGQCCLPIITRTSFGPAAFAFDPAKVGQALVPATQLLYYDALHPTLGPWEGSNLSFGATTTVGGMVIVPGTRTALAFGRNGLGPYCYGDGVNDPALVGPGKCYDPTNSSKGQHGYPYRYQIWAYDLNDFAAVKAGTKQPWDVKPYGVWPLDLPLPNRSDLGGATMDPQAKTIYVSQMSAQIIGCCGAMPVIHAIVVKESTTQTDPTIAQLKATIASLESRVAEIKKTLQAALPMPNNTKPALKTAVNKALALTTLPPPPVEPPPPPPPPPPVDPPPPPPSAGCAGSGLAWSCAAGTTVAQVNAAYASASDGATITFAAGAYDWTAGYIYLKDVKGVTLICAVQRACIVTVGAGTAILGDDFEGVNSKLYRISGFTFSGGSSKVIWFDRYQPTGLEKLTNIRIDHNRFINMAANAYAMFLGAGGLSAYGVVDHNELINAANATLAFVNGPTTDTITGARGTADAIFFEDNTVTITAPTNNGMASGCVDGWGAGSIVWRHNTTTNCLVSSHGVTHSWGPVNWEVYDNKFVFDAAGNAIGHGTGERALQHQGSGEILVFNNTASAVGTKSLNVFTVGHYRSEASCTLIGTCASPPPLNTVCDGTSVADGNRPGQIAGREGYPCKRQPGRDAAGRLQPMYAWNNRWADTGEQLKLVKIAPKAHIQANREYYNAVSKDAQTSPTSPFNGTHSGFVTAGNYGMGFGTLANRPTICTPTDLTLDAGFGGVGYFATDAGPTGTLYRCSAPNTWTAQYTPYPYPHPGAKP